MIRYMIVRDLKQFSLIYLIFITAFAQCIFLVNYGPNHSRQPSDGGDGGDGAPVALDFMGRVANEYAKLWMDLFKMTLGVYDLEPYRSSHLARLFLLLFIYLIPILFNM